MSKYIIRIIGFILSRFITESYWIKLLNYMSKAFDII